MEYVEGEPLTKYCDRHRLSISERIALLQGVCEGVQHAHQKGIIHRDLKPSNVLVTVQGNSPQPKVIDFGIAKATQHRLTEKTLFTELGLVVGTPEYMSPEQAEATGLDVDTRTDVYALGVMLYELLSGSLPFEPTELRNAGLEAIRRKIREEEPASPSERLSTLGQKSTAVANCRRTDPIKLASALRGDLDWITLKAIDKDRTRRYGSPSELSADLGRYLGDQPVQARPPTLSYKARKFLRRHKLGATVGFVGLLLLVGFSGAMAWQARRIAIERDRAEWVSKFLMSVFLAPDPEQARGKPVSARELLDRGAQKIEAEQTADPELRGRVMTMLGRTYEGLGVYDKAATLLEHAVGLEKAQLGPNKRPTIAAMHDLALVYWDLGRYADAERSYREAMTAGIRGLEESDPLTLMSMANLGTTLNSLGRHDEAEVLLRRALELRRRVRGPEHLETLSSGSDLALTWQQQGRLAEAENLLRQTVASMTRALGEESVETLKTKHNHALVLNLLRRYDEADALYTQALEGLRKILGETHAVTVTCMVNKAMNQANMRRFAEAESILQEALDIQRRVLGKDHPSTLNSVYNLGCIAALQGDRTAALSFLRQAVEQGYSEPEWMARDSDLQSLKTDSEFLQIVDHARTNAAARRAQSKP